MSSHILVCNNINVIRSPLQYGLRFGLPYLNHHKYEFSYLVCNNMNVLRLPLQYGLRFGLPTLNHHKYELLIGFLVWAPASKCLHLTTFSNMCSILSKVVHMFVNVSKCPKNLNLMNIVFQLKYRHYSLLNINHNSRGVHCTKLVWIHVSAQEGYLFGPCHITYTYNRHI
jgi:hypothetical protein